MTDRFRDNFNREDGQLGQNWEVPCGGFSIFDEAVRPIDTTGSINPTNPSSPVAGLTDERSQAIYQGNALDLPNLLIRGVWGHDDVTPTGVTGDPSFTMLARASKDPLLVDLGGAEEPLCYDQAYGLRVTCPLSGDAPVLKIIKKTPNRRINSGSASTAERDNATVLASFQLRRQDLNQADELTDDNKNDTTGVVYKGFWQDMRLRVRGTDGKVCLEAFMNDRHENQPILTYTDTKDPLWSVIGRQGFEFLSPVEDSQPAGASPFDQVAKSVMACTLFDVQTLVHFEQPRSVQPSAHYTYGRVVDRVIALVEKNGDAQYAATAAGQTKRQTYLEFVLEAEAEIIRSEGYFQWLQTEQEIYLRDDVDVIEMPEDFGELLQIRPGNWNGPPLNYFEPTVFRQYAQNIGAAKGKPRSFTDAPVSVNNLVQYRVFPIPQISSVDTAGLREEEDAFMVIEYYRRRIRPTDMDMALPIVPQADIDVLIYAAAAHGMLLDTDPDNRSSMIASYQSKLATLRRKNNRNPQAEVLRSVADVVQPATQSRLPILRSIQLESLL